LFLELWNSMMAAYSTKQIAPEQAGYITLHGADYCAVVREAVASVVAAALADGTLYEWAEKQPHTGEMRGRGAVYAALLPGTTVEVVVRRNSHGGLLRKVTGELFLRPTRAAVELATSLRLAAAGIPTPEIIAYAEYPLLGLFARSDVMTRRLPAGGDAPEMWQAAQGAAERDELLQAIAALLRSLAVAGAWHADLNLKNIYLADSAAGRIAYLLDVDRVTFPGAADVATRNFSRLARSVRKWRERWGLDFDEAALATLADYSRER
jgi:3-deoxy-D-manno-octulosonic acid kinase